MVREIKADAAPVRLSDEQLKKVAATYHKLGLGHDKEYLAKLEQAVWDVLTPDQRTQVVKPSAEFYVWYVFGGAGLTGEQTKHIAAMVDEYAKESRLATERPNLFAPGDKLREKINSLLTPEQKKAARTIEVGRNLDDL